MKVQKQLSKKRGDKVYYKYVVVFPKEDVETAGFKEGDELESKSTKGKIELRKKK
mgnify:CR=1 FL=1